MRNLGKYDHGIKVRKGDSFVFPAGSLQISANPLKGGGFLTESGVLWFAKMVFGADGLKQEDRHAFDSTLDEIAKAAGEAFERSPLLATLDLNDPSNHDKAFEIVKEDTSSAEWLNMMIMALAGAAQSAIEKGDANEAAWATSGLERFRAVAAFKSAFAEAVFAGQSVRRLVNLLALWDSNRENKEEGFWQLHFKENSAALSQAFSVPVTFIQDNAYVGGMQVDRKDARLLDFLFAGGSGKNAVLVEIKTPMTPLLGRQYRKGAVGPSAELSGAIAQVADYSHSLQSNLESITKERGIQLGAFRPKCLVLAGTYSTQITDEKRKRSFELFRTRQVDVDIITFDEFFQKIELLAKLFNVVRSDPSNASAKSA